MNYYSAEDQRPSLDAAAERANLIRRGAIVEGQSLTVWIDKPTLRLDAAGHREAARAIAAERAAMAKRTHAWADRAMRRAQRPDRPRAWERSHRVL